MKRHMKRPKNTEWQDDFRANMRARAANGLAQDLLSVAQQVDAMLAWEELPDPFRQQYDAQLDRTQLTAAVTIASKMLEGLSAALNK